MAMIKIEIEEEVTLFLSLINWKLEFISTHGFVIKDWGGEVVITECIDEDNNIFLNWGKFKLILANYLKDFNDDLNDFDEDTLEILEKEGLIKGVFPDYYIEK